MIRKSHDNEEMLWHKDEMMQYTGYMAGQGNQIIKKDSNMTDFVPIIISGHLTLIVILET